MVIATTVRSLWRMLPPLFSTHSVTIGVESKVSAPPLTGARERAAEADS
jgi:hypothetical protein